jgi:hypothetical protein
MAPIAEGTIIDAEAAAVAALDYADALRNYALDLRDVAETCSDWSSRVAAQELEVRADSLVPR